MPEQATDVTTVEQTRWTFEAVAKMVAKDQDGIRDPAVAHDPDTEVEGGEETPAA
ncbi:hypothetical protein [Streptomyces tendae]|uniref:hypothetical protein n=1 Tax=Streptomyces tendae TaxID=1932 RepID=UPI00142EEDC3|nr:hypothetical protein [Streptomyces tendae]